MGSNSFERLWFPIIDKEELKALLDNFKWSYSRVNSFKICPYMFFCTYILKEKGENGAFTQYGLFMHGIMEKYNKGELSEYELTDYYIDNYSKNITIDFPPNAWVDLSQSYYQAGLDYLNNFDGYADNIVEAEEKIDFEMDNGKRKIKFTGVVDRISKDDNGIVISDYKSKKKFKSKKEESEYFRQLYVYSIPVCEKYGELPYKLKFHFFRDHERKSEREFSMEDLQKAKDWIFDVIEEIYDTTDFDKNKNDFFCNYICSVPCSACDCKKQDIGGSWY